MLFQVKVLLLFSVLMMVRSQQKQYIFRMDDIEDWYHSDIQANMLNFFMDKGVAVSAGIIGDYVTGDDTALLATLQKCVGLGKSKCALFNHGADASYTYGSATSTSEAYTRMKTCDDKIKSLFPGYTVDLFVPHQNSWNQYTLAAAKQLGYAAVSASTESYSNMQYDITTDPLQLSQQTTTAVYNAAGSWDAYPIASTVAGCNTAASNGQVCVIMTHPHEFSEGSYTLTMLQQLVDALAAAGFTSVNFKDAIDQVKGLTKAPSAKPTANPTSKPTITMSPTYKATAAPTFDNRKRFIFRMDDIEDYYHNDIQANMLNFFIDKGVSVTAGVIGDYVTGEDTVLMTVLNRCVSVGVDKCALFNHGADASYTYGSATSTSEAYTRMKTCDDKIKSLFPGYTVDLFVPHQNSWNQYTLAAAKQLGYAAVSASTESYSNLQYDITTDPLQLSQQTTTAVYNDAGSWDAYPIASTVADCNTAASNGQVCVIMTHPHEFSEGSYTLTMLQQLVDALAAAGFSSVSVRKVVDEIKGTMRSPTTVPTASATKIPTVTPSRSPTNTPTIPSTKTPTQQPTRSPTAAFTSTPTRTPTTAPTTASTRTPTQVPTRSPTATPTRNPTRGPTATPTRSPTQGPTRSPTRGPTTSPSAKKTNSPSFRPSAAPTNGQPKPTAKPSIKPTLKPTSKPTGFVIQLDLLSILFPTLAKSHSLDSSSLPTDLLTYLMDHNIGVSVGVSSSSVNTDDTDYYNALKRCVSLGSSKCELYVQGSSSVSVQGNLGSVDDVKAQIQSADEKIKSLFDGYTPQVYVPSSGSWNNATLAAAKEVGFAAVASTDSSLGWDLSASPMQISPQTSTGVQDSTGTWSAKSTETIIADCTAASARGEACVIQMTANEFASGAYTTEKVSELVSGLQAAGFTDSMTFDTIISAVQGGSPTRAPSESPLDTSSTSKGGVMSYLSDPADYMIAVVVVVGLLLVAAVAYAVIMCNMRSKEEYNIVKSKSADLSSVSLDNFLYECSMDNDEEKSLPSTVRRSVTIQSDV